MREKAVLLTFGLTAVKGTMVLPGGEKMWDFYLLEFS